MKKLSLILAFVCISIGFASAQCVIDTTNTVLGFSPPDSSFPVILKGVPLDNRYAVQIYAPQNFTVSGFNITIHWITITNVTNFPTGITYTKNPTNDTVYGGNRACVFLSGVTTDTPGVYNLKFEGLVYVTVPILGDKYYTIHELDSMAAGQAGAPNLGYKLKEVDPAGINDISTELNAAMQISPNPSNGKFDVKFNFPGMLEGDLKVIDVTGREVYTQTLNTDGLYATSIDLSAFAKGIYSVQLRTEKGRAAKVVSIQ